MSNYHSIKTCIKVIFCQLILKTLFQIIKIVKKDMHSSDIVRLLKSAIEFGGFEMFERLVNSNFIPDGFDLSSDDENKNEDLNVKGDKYVNNGWYDASDISQTNDVEFIDYQAVIEAEEQDDDQSKKKDLHCERQDEDHHSVIHDEDHDSERHDKDHDNERHNEDHHSVIHDKGPSSDTQDKDHLSVIKDEDQDVERHGEDHDSKSSHYDHSRKNGDIKSSFDGSDDSRHDDQSRSSYDSYSEDSSLIDDVEAHPVSTFFLFHQYGKRFKKNIRLLLKYAALL